MQYFSQLKGKRVTTEEGSKVGKLTDLLFLTETQPTITKLVVIGKGNKYLIPSMYLIKINSVIMIKTNFTVEPLSDNELSLSTNLLDQQIIDINGNKVVRVNDVAIQDTSLSSAPPIILSIAGVDIGIVGILRWFGADETFGKILRLMGKTVTSRFLTWADIQPVKLAQGKVVLKKEENKLNRLKPEDLADHLETMSIRNVTRVLDLMEEPLAAKVVENLNITYQQSVFKEFAPPRSAKLIERMDPDDAVDILLSLSQRRQTAILDLLQDTKKKELERLLSLSNTPVGALITSEYFAANPEDTVLSIRKHIQKQTTDFSSLYYVYAVNSQGQVVGVTSLHNLLLQSNDIPLYRFMNTSVIVLHLTTPEEIAFKRMVKYKVQALPVIDDNKKILGIVTIDDVAESLYV